MYYNIFLFNAESIERCSILIIQQKQSALQQHRQFDRHSYK